MKFRFLLVAFLLLLVVPLSGQDTRQTKTKIRYSKNELLKKMEGMQQYIDSLQQIVHFYEEAAEILASDDSMPEEAATYSDPLADYSDYDSLSTEQRLSLYYHQASLQQLDNAVEFGELDSITLTSDIPDSVYIARLTAMNSFIKLPYNPIVKNYIITYTQKMPTKISTILGLAQYYMPIFEEVFDAYDMPLELKAMAVIESALNPRAVSRAKAKGMWQFMYRTALSYKLTINSYVDERLDPFQSAHAAAHYLQDSYRIFGDWALAIASYNCGVGNVNKAIRRAGGSQEFWDIYPFLPRETRGYVPAFVAALYTMKYFPEHQIKPQAVEFPAHVDTFEVNKMLHFEQIAAFTDISVDELRDMNPQYMKDIIPGVERTYILRLPFEYSGAFAEHEQEIYAYKDSVYFNPLILNTAAKSTDSQITHKVRRGETLSNIAYKYGVRIADIKYWNGLRSDKIGINQLLIIYTNRASAPAQPTASTSTKSATSTSVAAAPVAGGTLITHTVASGETLGGIAEKHRVSAANIRSWNKLSGSTIYPGQKLKIYSKSADAAASSTGKVTTSSATKYEYYTVKKGDTLWEISRVTGVSMETIRQLNGFGKTPKIYPNQKIRIKEL